MLHNGMLVGGMWIIWIFILGLIVYLVSKLQEKSKFAKPDDLPIEILNKRFANGELTQEEFKKKMKFKNSQN